MALPNPNPHKSNYSKSNYSTKSVPHKRRPPVSKRLRFHSASCDALNQPTSEFAKLNPTVPEQARRIQQRRRMISYGKNTVGYDEYIRKVPKNMRRKRSMETPATPDHTLDIPNKRWMGQLKAWRRALHRYDPPDLKKSFAEAARESAQASDTPPANDEPKSVRENELDAARASGALVDISITSPSKSRDDEMKELDVWEEERGDGDYFLSDDSDSDDDLL